MTSHTPFTGEDVPLPEANVGGGNDDYVFVIAPPLQEEILDLDEFVSDRENRKDNPNFQPAIEAINNVIVAIDGPTNKQACVDFVDGLAHCRNKPNHLFAHVYEECEDFFLNYSSDGDERKAKICGERLTVLLRLTIGTDKPARNRKQALLLMDALKHVDPFGILDASAGAERSNFLVSGASNLFLTLVNLVSTDAPLKQFRVIPNGGPSYKLDPEPLLVSTLLVVRKMVSTMTVNGKYLWMKPTERGGLGGFDFFGDMLFDKYIPLSDMEDTTRTGQTAMLNRRLAMYLTDIQRAMLNWRDN